MKKYATISLLVFWTITVAIASAGLVSYGKNNQSITTVGSNIDNVGQLANVASGVNPNITKNTLALTPAELAKHNSSQSCWLLISGKIYDVTTFINQHPGGDTSILQSCGTDATVAFNTRGGTGSHSSSAVAMLASYYIGDLNQTVPTSSANPTTPAIVNPSIATTNTSSGSGRHDDDDD